MPFDRRLLAPVLALLLAVGLAACDAPTAVSTDPAPDARERSAVTSPVPAQGTASTLDVGTWNLEWFGDTSNGPDDEALQLENVRDVIAGVEMDVWSVQEVTSVTQFEDLVAQLDGYDGFLANNAIVTDGDAYYSDFNDNELKPGLLYKSSLVTIKSARVILTAYDYEFAGRPPVEVQLSATVDGVTQSYVVILLHAKAGSGQDDFDRRLAASSALKTYIDDTWPSARVLVVGDFNDDVDESITNPKDSPYDNFVTDSNAYTFPTQTLTQDGLSSTVYYDDVIDHHLTSDEVIATYVDGSAQVFRADNYVNDYDGTTSDHYPVLSRYSVSGSTDNSAPTASFTVDCTDRTCDVDGSGSTDSDGSITSYAWDFGDGATASGSTASHTYGADGTYTVTLTVTDDDGATGTTAQDVNVSASASAITLSASGRKVKGRHTIDLTWSGATSSSVDVYRDGGLLTTTANDGAYTDATTNRGGASYVYQVCEAGTSTCSSEVTVTF